MKKEVKFLAVLNAGSVCWGSAWRIWRQEGHGEMGGGGCNVFPLFFPPPAPLPWLEVAGKAEPLHCYHRIYIASTSESYS